MWYKNLECLRNLWFTTFSVCYFSSMLRRRSERRKCKQQTIEVRQVIKLCLSYVLLFLTDFQTRVSRRSLPRYQGASMWPKCGHAIGLSLDELFEMSLRMFPNSLIIHKEKTKKITPWARFGYRILITIKFCGTLSLNFSKNDCSIEKLYPKLHSVFHPISRYPEVGLKKLGCVSFFNQLLVVWISDETLRVVLDIILLKKYRKIPKISPSVYKPLQI